MQESYSIVFYVDRGSLREAVMTFSFRKTVNWLEEGMSLMSWKYHLVAYTPEYDLERIYRIFKKWDGNAKSLAAGHRGITIGDIVLIGENPYLLIGGGWSIVPASIWSRIQKV